MDLFHSIVQKRVYIYKHAIPDLEPALSLLCTRMSKPSIGDEKKSFRVLDYLKETVDDVRVIEAKSLDKLYMWVNASYAVHPNTRLHTRGAISFGKGIILSRSSKQKLNTKSSMEAELVAVSDYHLYYHIWIIIF